MLPYIMTWRRTARRSFTLLTARAKLLAPDHSMGHISRARRLWIEDDSLALSGIEQRFLGPPASSLVIVLSCYMDVVQDFRIWTWLHFLCFRRLEVLPTMTA